MHNDDAMMAGEGDLVRAEELGPDTTEWEATGPEGEAPDEEAGEAAETLQIELDGEVYEIPAALKGAFLRQADYTRKTQDLAEQRRALEAERAALAEQGRAQSQRIGAGEGRERMQLAVLDEHLQELSQVDWEAFAAEDPQEARRMFGRYQELNAGRRNLAQALAQADELHELRAARAAAGRMAETGRKLAEEIEGWSPETAAKLVDYAQAFGVTLDELAQAADPRLWKLLHKAWRADEAGRQEGVARARELRPALTVSGSAPGGGGVRDELAVKDWMARRNDQTARGR
ncbi:hypothetical protein [Phenylobacterium sp.]|jgi:hypothetical protein|uniref:hypothetical protein n=1 Tax=Phenylobacterium sp. TaxID=1871053 RepID=UPI0037851C5E